MILAVHSRRLTFAITLKAERKDLQGNVVEYDYDPPQTDIVRVNIIGRKSMQDVYYTQRNNVLYLDWTPILNGPYHIDVNILTYEGVRFFARIPETFEVVHWSQIPEDKEVMRDLSFTLKLNRI